MFTAAGKLQSVGKTVAPIVDRVLLHFDGAAGSTNVVDAFGRPVTVVSGVTLETTQVKFGSAAGDWPGSGAYLEMPNTNDTFALGTSDFTIDSWLYRSGGGYVGGEETPWGTFQWQTGYQGGFRLQLTPTDMNFCAFSAAAVVSSGMALPLNAWTHVAVTRQGNVFRIFVNGVKRGEATNSGSIIMPVTHPPRLRLGVSVTDGGAVNGSFLGQQDEFNLIKGTALYTGDFTPPTAPYSNSNDPNFNNVTFLTPLESLPFTDVKGNTVDNLNVVLITASTKFGGAAAFNGLDTVLRAPPAAGLSMGAGDFTQEAWVKLSSLPASQAILWTNAPASGTGFGSTTIGLNLQAAGNVRVQSSYSVFVTGSAALPLNTWVHLAFTRQGSTMRLFINGALDASATVSNNFSDVTEFLMGKEAYNTTNVGSTLNGQIEELRVTKGVARYTAAFTPPALPFPIS